MNASPPLHPTLAYTRDPHAMDDVERCVAALGSSYFFGCGYPAGDDWVHALDLVGPDPHHLRRILLRSSADATEAASTLVRSYVTALVTIATATYLALPYVPDLEPANLGLRFDARGTLAALTLVEARCIVVAATQDRALRCMLWRTVVYQHIAPLIDTLQPHAPGSHEHLWSVTATACAAVMLRFDDALKGAPRRAA